MLNSKEAFDELKKLVLEEYGEGYSDMEIRMMGADVLKFVDIMTSAPKKPPFYHQ
jgi:urease gamma subunit